MIYLFPYLIIFLIGNHYLFVKLDPEKYILIVEKKYKIFKINIMKDFNRINLSVCYWLLNEKEKALKYLNEIKITRLTLPIIKYCYYRNLMEYKYFMGEKEEARKIFDENFRKSGEKLVIGIMLDYEKNPQQKIIEFEKLLKGKRKLYQIEIKFNLAKTYEEIGNFEKAEKYFQEVIEKVPHLRESAIKKLINVYNSQANIYLTNGDFNNAEKYLLILIKEYGINECYYNLAILNKKKGNKGKYKEYILKGCEFGDSKFMYNYALFIYSETGKYTKEVDMWLKKAAEKEHVVAMYELGLFAFEEGRIEDSKKWYMKAIEKGHTTAMNNLANIYSKEGHTEEAMKLYLKAAEKSNPIALFNIGNYYEGSDDIELAKQYYSKVLYVLKVHPDTLKEYSVSELETETMNRLLDLENLEKNSNEDIKDK